MAARSPTAVRGPGGRAVGVALTAQVDRLLGPFGRALRRRRWSQLWLGAAGAALVVLFALLARTRSGEVVVRHIAVVEDYLPLPVLLARLPLSIFAPASLLPFWFAVLQVGVVFAAAQAALGTRRTVLVSFAGHAAATLSVRLWIWLGTPVGLSRWYLHYPDAGPSAAVLALLAYLAVSRRVTWLALVLVGYQVVESATLHGATQREHLVGVLVGALLAAAGQLARQIRAARRRAQPIQMSVTGVRRVASPIPPSPHSASTVRSSR
ncbi:MAG TPA: hypothetical protein VF054_07555 [Micromonosporaceae bacterium]